jgi:hypothetical protein
VSAPLVKMMRVLDRHDTGQGVVFRNPEDYLSAPVKLSPHDDRDMGFPKTITVTIEPGDLLNDEEASE